MKKLAVGGGLIALVLALLDAQPLHAATYTWSTNNVYSANTTLDWFTGGPNTQGTWTNGFTPVSTNTATIQFYENITTAFTNTTAITRTVNLNNIGSAFELGTLTFNGLGSATANANLTNNLTGDALNFSGATGTINLNANRAIIYNLNNNIQLGTASSASALTITGNGTGTFNIKGNISELQAGGGSLIKSGSSTVTLTGNNSYSGGTVLNAGALSISANNNLGAATSAITVNGNSRINSTAAGNVDYTRAIALTNGAVLTLQNTTATTASFSGAITGAGGITMVQGVNANVIALSSTSNSFTGNLTLPNTTLNDFISFASIGDGGLISIGKGSWRGVVQYTGSSNLVLNTRQIALNSSFAGVDDGGGNPINAFENNGAGTVTFNANMSVTNNRTGTFFFGGSNTNDNTFAGIIPNSTGGTLSIGKYGSGKWILSGTNTFTGSVTIRGGILQITSIDNVANANPLGQSSASAANLLLGNGTTLRYTGGTNSSDRAFTINGTGAGNSATLDASGSGPLNLTSPNSPGYGTVNQTRTLNLIGSNEGLNTLAASITNNGSGAVTLSKSGGGTWVLTGTSTYTGTTTINGGVLEALDGTGLPTNSILQLRGGVFQSTGTFNRVVSTAAGAVNWSTSSGGFAARGGALNLQLDGSGKTNTWNGASFVLTGNALIFGSTTADNVVDFQNTLKLAASGNNNLTRTITVNDNANSATDLAKISGKIITDSLTNGIVKNGNGVLELTGANTYNGVTTVSNGTLLVNNTTGSGTGSGAVTVIGGATLGGSGTISGNVTLSTGGTLSPGNSIGTLTVSNLTLQSGSFLNYELGLTSASDKVVATGTLNLGTLLWSQFTFTTNTGFDAGTYTLIDATGLSGSVDGSTNSLSGYNAYLWANTSAKDLMLTVIAIPEPSSLALVGLGILGAVAARRYQQKR